MIDTRNLTEEKMAEVRQMVAGNREMAFAITQDFAAAMREAADIVEKFPYKAINQAGDREDLMRLANMINELEAKYGNVLEAIA